MGKVRVVYRADGGVSIIVPAPKSRRERKMTVLEALKIIIGPSIVITRDDNGEIVPYGQLELIKNAYKGLLTIHDETEAEWLERVFSKAMRVQNDLYARPYDDVDESEIPKDRTYRNAWTGSKGNGISIDAVKKAEIDAERARPTDREAIEALETRVVELEAV